ncbi:MAG: glycosyltransferase family 2 protein [Clostridia bacterium]|nr:glycosyltransferase family 2 protein [Clostridia bacterium]
MKQNSPIVQRDRLDLKDPYVYILQGSMPKEAKVQAFLDKTPVKAETETWIYVSALERCTNPDSVKDDKVTVRIHLPSNLNTYKKLSVYYKLNGKRSLWFSVSVKDLISRQKKPQLFIEELKRDTETNICSIRGWAVGKEPVVITVTDCQHNKLNYEVQYVCRPDVRSIYQECRIEEKCGFYLEMTNIPVKDFILCFSSGSLYTEKKVSMRKEKIFQEKIQGYADKGIKYLKSYGFLKLAQKTVRKLTGQNDKPVDYSSWQKKHFPDKKTLEIQKNTKFQRNPRFSVVVPLYKTPEKYLRDLVKSLQDQTYPNWELCLSDGSGADSPLTDLLQSLQKEDSRIRVVYTGKKLNISDNTNCAISQASGDFIVFADHDDELTPDALFECTKAVNEHPKIQVIYSDEDKMTMDGRNFFQPHFKPDFNIDLLCTVNYICHLFVARKDLVDQTGPLRGEFDGAQDYDFIFRCVETAGRDKIYHIPRILYHWRCHEDSTAENPESKRYAFDAGKRVVQAHYDRTGIKAKADMGEYLGLYRTRYIRDYDPLISIIIPNKDHIDDLKRCLDSINKHSTYRNYEFIIVENNSEDPETFEFYKQLEASDPKAHVVYWKGIFNYSSINNFGEKYAKGEYLLLLNNDTEMINEDCLEELLGYCMRPDVGAVGARLYYEDDTIQHAGVVIGFGGIAGHCFVFQPRGTTGYFNRIICAQDYSAVTAACMMVKKKAYEEVGGLSEEFQVAFNDIDFCLRLGQAGYLIVYNPYAELYHYESKSRGLEDTPEKVARFNGEIELFEKKWPDILKNGDPYYNPNLTLESQDFSLKRI